MDLWEDLRLLNSNFLMIYIIHKIFVLLENHLSYLKDNIFKCFLRSMDFVFSKKKIFFIACNDGKSKGWKRKHN